MGTSVAGPRVLVVDDDDAIRECISEVLRDEGYEVICAGNGAQALDVLEQGGAGGAPGLVLLDLMMPVMSGWEVLERMQESARLSQVPVVVVSAMCAPGVCAHLGKPVDIEILLRTVARFARASAAPPSRLDLA